VPIDGGPCVRVGEASQTPAGSHHEGLSWSPDDQWIIIHPIIDDRAVIQDCDGPVPRRHSWIADGADSWQRTAP
jgi:hypothetical protein